MEFSENTEIVFEAGNILSVQMLEETYRYPREFLHLAFYNFCDGIICGLDFIAKNDGVYLTAGIVKISGKYYAMPQDINMDEWLNSQKPALQPETVYDLRIVCKDILTANDKAHGIKSHSKVFIRAISEEKLQEKDMPRASILLAKYKPSTTHGISLPSLDKDAEKPFYYFYSEGLLQVVECEYAHPRGGTTYHPLVFRAIRGYLEQKKPLSPYDFSLLMEIQNNGIVAMTALKSYIVAASEKAITFSEKLPRKKFFDILTSCVQKEYTPFMSGERMDNSNTKEQPSGYTGSAWIDEDE